MAVRFLKLFLDEISDKFIQDNFKSIVQYVREEPFRKGQFRFVEISCVAGTNKFAHNLNFQPADVILLSIRKSDAAVVRFLYDQFTRDHIFLTVNAPCTVRAYIGSYKEL